MNSFRLRLLLVPFIACMALLGAILLLPATAASAQRPIAHGQRPPVLRSTSPVTTRAGTDKALVKMTIRDVVPLPEANTHAVVLISEKDDTILPVFVDEETALAVALRLAHKASPAPLAADLLGGAVSGFGGKIVAVKLDSLVADEFTGRVQFSRDGENFEVPARPADALAAAMDNGAAVYANAELLHDVGISKAQIEELRKSMPGGDEEQAPGVGGSGNAGKSPPQSGDDKVPPSIEL